MRKTRPAEDLTIEELRRLLVEKRRAVRHEQLERFRRTGRVVSLASDVAPSLDHQRAGEAGDLALPLESPRSRLRRLFDGVLLLVEILAVVGLVFVLFNGMQILRGLNQEYAQGLEQPTLTPTPLIMAVVLPGGHTPPDAQGRTGPNEAEIPEHLRPLVQALENIPVPTPGPEQATRIRIPAINVDAPIVQGDAAEQLKKGVGQHIGSANPGEKGNVVLSAHNDVYGEIFRRLDQLKKGDEIILYTNQKTYIYTVIEAPKVVEPTAVEVMAPTKDPIVTLTSCYPYMVDKQRIIIRGLLKSSG